ncbi:MAG: NAD(+)/NADH kinase [Kiritimatiellae bacterium]|nr:NAD(+)/NADH kinase [Kiritimatiellia bacterium]
MKTVGVIVNADKPRAESAVAAVFASARRLGLHLLVDPCGLPVELSETVTPLPAESFREEGAEAVIVLGGDGSMLDAVRRSKPPYLPMIGLNIGSLGYLTSVEEPNFVRAMEMLREGAFQVSRRSMVAAEIISGSGTTLALPDALNEVVVSRGASGTSVELDLQLNGKTVSRFLCDGMIVATPTGSTAYSLSAGGPILLPDVEALVVNLICPHTLTSRPLVVPHDALISIRVASAERDLNVSADGRDNVPVQVGDVVRVVRSARSLPVIMMEGVSPCDVMRRKLGWGGRQHARQRR